MKRALIYSLLPVMAVFIFVAAQNSNTVGPAAQETPDLGWPDEVVALLENSCYDCHSSDSGNLKARQKLNFLKWEELKVSKQVGKLNDISEEVKEKKMPPEKYIGKNPDKALSDEQISVITNWANTEAQKLMEE